MVLFLYTAKNAAGEQYTDTMEADAVKTVAQKLQATGYYPVTIEPFTAKRSCLSRFSFFRARKIRHNDVVLFTRRLADCLKGGLSLVRALGILVRQTENVELKKVTVEIHQSVQEGKNFSEVLGTYPDIFPDFYVGMVQAGVSGGLLETVLERLAEFLEKEQEMSNRIKAALAYPLVIMSVGVLSVIFLLTFVIPKFEIMFQDLGQMLPLPTRILIACSNILQNGWWLYVPALAGLMMVSQKFYRTKNGRKLVDTSKLRSPLFGNLLQKEMVSRFIRMFSNLLGNGVPILDALLLAKHSVSNQVLAAEIDTIHQSVKEGRGLVKPISESAFFPPMVADMIAIGEETGNLEAALIRVADIYEREVGYALKAFTSILEPVIILAVGLMVAFIAMSMLLPVFQMSAIMK